MKLTWAKGVLLTLAVLAVVDAQFVPRFADPGPYGEISLIWILGYRAVSKRELSWIAVFLGGVLTILIALANHNVIKCRGFGCLSIFVIVSVLFLFWGRVGQVARL